MGRLCVNDCTAKWNGMRSAIREDEEEAESRKE